MTGAIAHADVPEMLSIADIAVVPSAPVPASRGGTGTPLKLFEYMAAGKPIVATAINQAAEVIQDGQNGILVEAGNVNRFAEAILTLLNDPVERLRLGQNAGSKLPGYTPGRSTPGDSKRYISMYWGNILRDPQHLRSLK